MKNIFFLLSTLIIVLLCGFLTGILIIPVWFLLKLDSSNLDSSNLDNIILDLEVNQDQIFSTDFSVDIDSEVKVENNIPESFQDKVMNYLENLGIEECESSISKIKSMRSDGAYPIIEGETFDIIFKDDKVLFQVPDNFEDVLGLRIKMIKCTLLFEMCTSKKMDEEEKKSLNPIVRKLARKLARTKEIMDYEPIICV